MEGVDQFEVDYNIETLLIDIKSRRHSAKNLFIFNKLKDEIREKLVRYMGTKKAYEHPRLMNKIKLLMRAKFLEKVTPKHKKKHQRSKSPGPASPKGKWEVKKVDMQTEDYEYLN